MEVNGQALDERDKPKKKFNFWTKAALSAALLVGLFYYSPFGSYLVHQIRVIVVHGFSEEGMVYMRAANQTLPLFYKDLPGDESLIELFRDHREDFEYLAKNYKGYQEIEAPDIRAAKERIGGLYQVAFVGNYFWLANPYDIETAREVLKMARAGRLSVITDTQGREMLFERKDWRLPYWSKRFSWVSKNIHYFPIEPRIANGELLWPVGIDGKPKGSARVLSELDHSPWEWRRGECLYRSLEPHWFIRLCNS